MGWEERDAAPPQKFALHDVNHMNDNAYYMGKRGMNFKRMIKDRQKQDAERLENRNQHEREARDRRYDEHTKTME